MKINIRLWLGSMGSVLLWAAAVCSLQAQTPTNCGLASPLPIFPAVTSTNNNGVQIGTNAAADALLFRLPAGRLSLDLDGAPTTYGVLDQGIDDLCNGLSPLSPPECRGVAQRGACFAACRAAIRAWDRTPAGARSLFCSIGVGGGCGPSFSAPLQPPPNDLFFVSQTSVKYAAPPGAPSNWLETQAAQLDSLQVPYFVLPPRMRAQPFDASPGDAGVMIRTDRPHDPVFFIIGDGGNNSQIGEASARAHQLLSTTGVLPTRQTTNAFGQPVSRVWADAPPTLAVAIFRHTSQRPGGTGSLISLTPETINAWIQQTGAAGLARLGGAEALAHCAPPVRPPS